MTHKFVKALLASSIFALATFGLTACDSDNGTSPSNGGSSVPVPTTNDAEISFDNLKAAPAGSIVNFTGTLNLDASDTNITNQTVLQFDSLQFYVTAEGSNKTIGVTPTVTGLTFPITGTASINQKVTVDLKDAAFTECGSFDLLIIAYATIDTVHKSSSARITFNRSADLYCKAAESSSSGPAVTEIEMTSYEVTLSTNTAQGLDLATGTASTSTTADIVIVKNVVGTNADVNVTSGNGTLFAPINNADVDASGCTSYSVGYWPETWGTIGYTADICPDTYNKNTVYVSDFKYNTIAGESITNIISEGADQIYVAKTPSYNASTGAGFYAFGMTARTAENNNGHSITLKVYKVK